MKTMDETAFESANVFGTGAPNDAYSRYFTGKSFLNRACKLIRARGSTRTAGVSAENG